MVRGGGASTPSKRKEKEGAVSAEDKAEEAESKRLRDLGFSRRLLSRSRSHVHNPSLPSKTILNSDGKDIVKKGHRKSKYLFAFPGLLSPISGGKLGELTNLDTRNPTLYVEFPQGRLKLFGTIVYPKNKYLTLHFQRGAGNVICEDCFESLIVFSNAWWIGTKEQNPEEVRLPLPKDLEQYKHTEIDFTAGAGETKDSNKSRNQLEKSENNAQTTPMAKPEVSEVESIGKDGDAPMIGQSLRQSARTAGRKLKYADSSSDSENSDSDESQESSSSGGEKQLEAPKELSDEVDTNIGECSGAKAGSMGNIDDKTPKRRSTGTAKVVEKIPWKTTPKSKNSRSTVLKQSHLESFCRSDTQENIITAVNAETIVDLKEDEVNTSAVKASVKGMKRPRQTLEDAEGSHSNDEDDDIIVVKSTPSKHRKQVKTEQGAGTMAASKPMTENLSASKGRNKSSQDRGGVKQKAIKAKTPATANVSTPKGRKGASRLAKSLKEESSDFEEEDSDSEVASDDSDEDYTG